MRRSSFTLVELLVVIAVSALLIAVLSPSLQRSRQQAKAVFCSSNVKQLTYSLLMYDTVNQTLPYSFNVERDSNGKIIYPPDDLGNRTYDKKGWWWLNYISNYSGAGTRQKRVYWCPSRRIKDPAFDYVLYGNYGVNQFICKKYKKSKGTSSPPECIGKPLCVSDISRPAETLLVVDSGYSIINWWHDTNEPPEALDRTLIENTAYVPGLKINKELGLWPSHQEDAIDGRHPNKTVNVGFVDGHMSRKKADDLFAGKIEDDYKNKSPLWVPE